MKKTLAIILGSYFYLLFFQSSLFALPQNNKLIKPHPNSKYARIVVCSKALEALGKIGDPRSKEVLISGLKDKEFFIRTAAAQALSRLGDKKTIPLLKKSLNDESYLIRILVTKALLNLGQLDMEKNLLDFLNSSEVSERAFVVMQLGEFKDKYLPRLAEVLAKDKSDLVRLRAIQQLGLNRFNPAIPLIKQALKDPNPKIRQVACIALGQLKDNKAWPLLIQRLSDEDPLVRAAAKEGITELKPEQEKLSKVISVGTTGEKENGLLVLLRKDLDNKDPGLRVSSFVGLAKFEDVTILPLLLKEVVLPRNTTFVKRGAARALRILKPFVVASFDGMANSRVISSVNLELNYKVNGQNLLSLIINALEDSANPLHSDSVFILGELKDDASRPALRQALSQEDSEIVANAAYVLGLFEDQEAVPDLINVCNRYGL